METKTFFIKLFLIVELILNSFFIWMAELKTFFSLNDSSQVFKCIDRFFYKRMSPSVSQNKNRQNNLKITEWL